MTGARAQRHASCAAAALAIALLAGGCTPDFDKVWLVKDLRVLAMQADPPEVLATSLVAAVAVPKVTITALAVDPTDPDREALWEMWACTADGTTCEDAATSELVTTRRTRLDQIRAEVTPSPQLLAEALKEDPGHGLGGVPLVVMLKIQDAKLGVVLAIKRVVYGLALPLSFEALTQGQGVKPPPAEQGEWAGTCRSAAPRCDDGLDCVNGLCLKHPNQNPSITGVTADKQAVDSGWSVAAGEEISLLPAAASGDKEPYVVQTFTGATRSLDEYLRWNYFTTSGELSNDHTGGKPSPLVDNKKVKDISSDWTPADLSQAASQRATLWIVVHDDRGGVGWTAISAQVGPPKP